MSPPGEFLRGQTSHEKHCEQARSAEVDQKDRQRKSRAGNVDQANHDTGGGGDDDDIDHRLPCFADGTEKIRQSKPCVGSENRQQPEYDQRNRAVERRDFRGLVQAEHRDQQDREWQDEDDGTANEFQITCRKLIDRSNPVPPGNKVDVKQDGQIIEQRRHQGVHQHRSVGNLQEFGHQKGGCPHDRR